MNDQEGTVKDFRAELRNRIYKSRGEEVSGYVNSQTSVVTDVNRDEGLLD